MQYVTKQHNFFEKILKSSLQLRAKGENDNQLGKQYAIGND